LGRFKRSVIDRLRAWARALKRQLVVVSLALRDARTPWFAKVLGVAVVAYALSPIDLIPDFIPVLGLLDDLVIVPLGLWLVLRWLPAEVLRDAQAQADRHAALPPNRVAAGVVVMLWVLGLGLLLGWFLMQH
jgi:uncharacterized membrane protein YkvA (DUF1232 family)